MYTEWVPKLFSLKINEKQAANHRCQGCDNEVQDVKAISFKVFWKCINLWSQDNRDKYIYYINTNEIPSELSRKNLISSHVKITCYLHMWKYHHCYGLIINRTFQTKNFLSKMVWHFIGVYIINRILHGRLEIWNFSSCVEKNISLVRCTHSWIIFQHSQRNFISLCGNAKK